MNDGVAALRCPHCEDALMRTGSGVVCDAGHTFDAARQGYLNLKTRNASAGDDADMIATRAAVLDAGVFEPLLSRLAAVVAGSGSRARRQGGVILDVGAGPGVHLARVLQADDAAVGITLDSSKYAARRAARAHPRITSVVADVWDRLPLATGSVTVLLNVFAPRNGSEFARVLRTDGSLVVVTPRPDHLAELREPFDLLKVDPRKMERVDAAFQDRFTRAHTEEVRWRIVVTRSVASAIVRMGPSAHHVEVDMIARAARNLNEPLEITGAVDLTMYQISAHSLSRRAST